MSRKDDLKPISSTPKVDCIHQFCMKVEPEAFRCLTCKKLVDAPYGKEIKE